MKDIIVRAAQVTDPSNEVLFAVEIVDGRLRARRASPSFFAFLRSSRYIVRRRFDPSEVVLGTTLKILNKASGDELEITPRITVEGAAETKLQQVVESFHDHYTAQESWLKSTVARLLTSYIEQDSDPIKALFEPGLNKNWDYQLRRDLLDQLGLEARIEIVFDPEVAPWIEKIRGHPARRCDFSFTALFSARPFKVSFSFRVIGISFGNWNALKGRARTNLSVEREYEAMETRIRQILEPVIATFPPQALVCNHAIFWARMEYIFAAGVNQKIAAEFGCRVEISGLVRSKNFLEEELDKGEDPKTIEQIANWQRLRDDAMSHFSEILRLHYFDLNHKDVMAAKASLDDVDKKFELFKRSLIEKKLYEPVREEVPPDEAKLSHLLYQTAGLLELKERFEDSWLSLNNEEAGTKPALPENTAERGRKQP